MAETAQAPGATPQKAASKAAAADGAITCPYCGDMVGQLAPIESGMRLSLQENAQLTALPEAVCLGCHGLLAKMISKGAVLRANAQAKEQNRLMLWRNRVALVKKAKEFLAQKNFSEAAIHYEKYIRILEVVFEKQAGELSPELFGSDARKAELTVVASVYWDLMRIYDQSPKYRDRQQKASQKLVEFIRFTPVNGHILRKAESLTRTAKNPDVFKQFLKAANKSKPRCFIATAAFDGYEHPTVSVLQSYRDRVLRKTRWGRLATGVYYFVSPPIAFLVGLAPAFLRQRLQRLLTTIANRVALRHHL